MSISATAERLSARVTGRVQGVNFRNFTKTKARGLDLTGWVENEGDGSVRVEAEGPRDALDDLLDALRNGSRMAEVEDISADWGDADGSFDSFEVRH
jgi:acylphosphatase